MTVRDVNLLCAPTYYNPSYGPYCIAAGVIMIAAALAHFVLWLVIFRKQEIESGAPAAKPGMPGSVQGTVVEPVGQPGAPAFGSPAYAASQSPVFGAPQDQGFVGQQPFGAFGQQPPAFGQQSQVFGAPAPQAAVYTSAPQSAVFGQPATQL
jgi:hypothetical protein